MGFWDLRFFTCRASRLLADRLSPACAPGAVGVEVLNPPWAPEDTGNDWGSSQSRLW